MAAVVVEHVIVTTLEADATVAAVSGLLARHGFVPASGGAFAASPDMPVAVDFVKKKRRQAFRLANDLLSPEQLVHIAFDRGRVTIVAALENLSADMGRASRGLVSGRAGKAIALQTDWLMAVARSIEARLVGRVADEVAEQPMLLAAGEAKALARKKARRALIALLVIFVLIPALIAVAIVASDR